MTDVVNHSVEMTGVRKFISTKKEFDQSIKLFFCGDKLLNPSQLSLTAPVRGMPTSTTLQSGVPAASTFFKSLADADDAALMRLFIELRILVNDGKHVDQMHIF